MLKNSIVLVPFPFDDFSITKVRPALCLTSKIGVHNHIIIAFISSKVSKNMDKFDILLTSNLHGWEQMGLRVDSVIKLHKLVTIPQVLIKRELGIISEEVQMQVQNKIKTLFGQP